VTPAQASPARTGQPATGTRQQIGNNPHPGRLRSEAAFAMLAGVALIEASSGRVVRHRLNRGGDRQLNRAVDTIVMIRQRFTRRPRPISTSAC
jgi:transposase